MQHYYKLLKANMDMYLLCSLVFLLPFERIPSVDAFGVTLRLSFLAAALVILRASYLLVSQKSKALKLRPSLVALLCFATWVAISGLSAINYSRALQVIIFTLFTILTAISVTIIYEREYLDAILRTLIFSAVIVAIFGLYQYLGNILGLPNQLTGLRERYSWQIFGFPRIQSTGLEPLYYCSYLLLPTSIVVVRLMSGIGSVKKNAALVVLFATSIFLTVSRGGILAFVGMLLFILGLNLYCRTTSWRRVFLVVGLAALSFITSLIAITYLAKPPTNAKVTGGKKGTVAYTKQLQNTGLEGGGDERAHARAQALAILNSDNTRYIAGVGAGQFGPYTQNNAKGSGGWMIVNNEPIEMLLELGLIGVCLFASFSIFLALDCLRQLRIRKGVGAATILALLGYLFATAIQYQTFSTLYIMHIWVGIGLLMAVTYKKRI